MNSDINNFEHEFLEPLNLPLVNVHVRVHVCTFNWSLPLPAYQRVAHVLSVLDSVC